MITALDTSPAPWRVYGEGQAVCDARGNAVATVEAYRPGATAQHCYHVAELIAAAPDLLVALQECITESGALAFASEDFYRAKQRIMAISNIARAAIAKATD